MIQKYLWKTKKEVIRMLFQFRRVSWPNYEGIARLVKGKTTRARTPLRGAPKRSANDLPQPFPKKECL